VEGFLELIGRRRQVIAAHLGDVQSLDFADKCLTIVTAPGDSWLELALRRDANRAAFESCLESAFGAGARWRITAGIDTPAGGESDDAGADAMLEHPTVQAALEVFGGTAETIDEANS
jgi:hypothetical protein